VTSGARPRLVERATGSFGRPVAGVRTASPGSGRNHSARMTV